MVQKTANANISSDRRESRRDRRFVSDRRSSVLPNLTDNLRRIAVRDRRCGITDRRVQNQATVRPHLMCGLLIGWRH